MNDELRDLLSRGAARPTADVDLDALDRSVQRSRRRRASAMVAGVVVVALLAVGVASQLGGGSAQVVVTPRQPGPSVPDGWKVIESDAARLSIAVPDAWTRIPELANTAPGQPDEVLVVGSGSLERTKVIGACGGSMLDLPADPGTWVSVFEFAAPIPGTELVMPGGETWSASTVVDRPTDFGAAGGVGTTCPTTTPTSGGADPVRTFRTFVFRDAGRLFVARIVAVGTVDDPGLDVGYAVLDTLTVEPSPDGTVATTVPDATPTTTVPAPTASVPMVTGPGTTEDDAQAIARVFLEWIDAQPKDSLDGVVEDFASIADSLRQGMAQHTPEKLATYSGRVESVRVVDATHADVGYTILLGGQPQFLNRPGHAIKVDGRWMVTRETVCDLLTAGGITCPPRA